MSSKAEYKFSDQEYVLSDQQEYKKTIIVGWNIEAANLYDRILSAPALGYNVVGFIKPTGDIGKRHYKNVPVLGDLSTIKKVLLSNQIQEVLIVLSESEKRFLDDIIKVCTQSAVPYRLITDAYDQGHKHVIRQIINDVWSPTDFGLRRIVDIIGSVVLLILFFPLFIVTSLAIKLESKGHVFYTQNRYGKNQRVFSVFKFRSMVQDAEKKSGPVWASKRDPRITKVGLFMRKTRIDELPQLLNVLAGEMSFIGPRPERPFFADTLKNKIPLYLNRLRAKPGITGLAQVTVGYDETLDDVKQKVTKDIEYIENKNSLKMNAFIIWKTIQVVLTGGGQ